MCMFKALNMQLIIPYAWVGIPATWSRMGAFMQPHLDLCTTP
jgi:hypothetical protein